MKTVSAVVIGTFVFGILGYDLGALVACEWLYSGSNLCGLVGVFMTGPLGAIAGGLGGLVLSPRVKVTYTIICVFISLWLFLPALSASNWYRLMVMTLAGGAASFFWVRDRREIASRKEAAHTQ